MVWLGLDTETTWLEEEKIVLSCYDATNMAEYCPDVMLWHHHHLHFLTWNTAHHVEMLYVLNLQIWTYSCLQK